MHTLITLLGYSIDVQLIQWNAYFKMDKTDANKLY